jgi:hypothetical protein
LEAKGHLPPVEYHLQVSHQHSVHLQQLEEIQAVITQPVSSVEVALFQQLEHLVPVARELPIVRLQELLVPQDYSLQSQG